MPLNFVDRHNGPRQSQIKQMLDVIGVSSIDELIRQTIPADILLHEPLKRARLSGASERDCLKK